MVVRRQRSEMHNNEGHFKKAQSISDVFLRIDKANVAILSNESHWHPFYKQNIHFNVDFSLGYRSRQTAHN